MTDKSHFEIIAFRLHDQLFCVPTTSIREIRGWAAVTPIPHSPPDVIGVMNLRGSVIPIIDLAVRLGMRRTEIADRSAIVVAEVGDSPIGLVVDTVSDILTIASEKLQPVPDLGASVSTEYTDGVIAQPDGMICFLNLDRLFERQSSKAA